MRSKGGASGPSGTVNRPETFLQRVAPLNVEARHIEGLQNTAADAPSRIPRDATAEAKEGGKAEYISPPVMTRSQHRSQKTRSEKMRQELQEGQKADAEIEGIAAYPKKRSKLTPKERTPYASWHAHFDLVDDVAVRAKSNKMTPH